MTFTSDTSLHHSKGQPFDSVEEAWFWCVDGMTARNDGARITAGHGNTERPCEPIDIAKVVDRLYRNRNISRDHLRVLKHYGIRHMAPDPRRQREAKAFTLWDEVMMRMEAILERKGIIYPSTDSFHDVHNPDFDIPGFLTEQGFQTP
jgi:hypothetical protein